MSEMKYLSNRDMIRERLHAEKYMHDEACMYAEPKYDEYTKSHSHSLCLCRDLLRKSRRISPLSVMPTLIKRRDDVICGSERGESV